MTNDVITTHRLTKTFGALTAVRELDLSIAAGELVALLGPNGAGKSTTLRMLTTLLTPTSGTARVAGVDVCRDPGAVRRRIGYVAQGDGAGHLQLGRDELVAQGRAHGMSRQQARSRAEELLAALKLTEYAGRQVATLSGGQRRRLDVALGLVHRPPVLFLDEPSPDWIRRTGPTSKSRSAPCMPSRAPRSCSLRTIWRRPTPWLGAWSSSITAP